jgi:hypothetical protein
MTLTIATHNLLDGKAPATGFANIIFFTEAGGANRSALTEWRTYTCERQQDLVIAVDRELGWSLREHYKRAHWGVRKVTPHRGTYWLTNDIVKVALLVEHRINAGFPPYKRGEALFRKTMWAMHTAMTLKIIRRLKKQGYTVYAGGDLNTPVGVSGYKGVLNEVGRKYDRLGSTRELTDARRLSPLGSDHFRLRATVQ